MKSNTFKILLSLYGQLTYLMIAAGTCAVPILGDIVSHICDIELSSAYYLIGGTYTILSFIIIKFIINKKLYKQYQEKLQDDALLMIEQLRMNHLCSPTKLDELEKELKEADLIKS